MTENTPIKKDPLGYDTIGEEIDAAMNDKENNETNEGGYGQRSSEQEEREADESSKLNENPTFWNSNPMIVRIKKKLSECTLKVGNCFLGLFDKFSVEPSFKLFGLLLIIGLLFLVSAILTIPFLLLSPTKFLMTFSIGNILVLLSFLFYYGSKEYYKIIFSKTRIWLTISFLAAIIFGLIAVVVLKSWVISLILACFQIVAVCFFILSFIPGGRSGIEFFKSIFINTFLGLFKGIKSTFTKKEELPQ